MGWDEMEIRAESGFWEAIKGRRGVSIEVNEFERQVEEAKEE